MKDLPTTPAKKVFVLGGSGALGQALLWELAEAKADVVAFTYHQQHDAALALGRTLGFTAHCVDLRQPQALPDLFRNLALKERWPDVVVHCAGVAPALALAEIDAEGWDTVHAVHGRAALQCAQLLSEREQPGALVLVAALDGLLPVPAPAHYAASQAAMWGLTMALAKELGPKGILVNLAMVGVLDAGISTELAPALRASYQRYAALGRAGTCAEAARGLRWLALENTYLNGARFPLTGGLG
ncbi:MAG: SDR family oxidoreductase [Pseudomonadota bacterium]